MAKAALGEPAKLLLLANVLSKDRLITINGKAFLKELILSHDPRLKKVIDSFAVNDGKDTSFVNTIQELIDDQARKLYNYLFEQCTLERGKTTSKKEREQKGLNSQKSLIYGEVEFQSFGKVLRKLNLHAGGIFYDLGSGTGRAIFIARFLHDFAQCRGIEILEGLHREACANRYRYETGPYRKVLGYGSDGDCVFIHGSILDIDWSDGDVVFANSTCFDGRLTFLLFRTYYLSYLKKCTLFFHRRSHESTCDKSVSVESRGLFRDLYKRLEFFKF